MPQDEKSIYERLAPLSKQARLAVACASVEHVAPIYAKGEFKYLVGKAAKVLGSPAKADMIATAIKLAWKSAESGKALGARVLDAFDKNTSEPPKGMEREDMSLPALQVLDATEALLEATHDATPELVGKLIEGCTDALYDMVESLADGDSAAAERAAEQEESWQRRVIAQAAKLGTKIKRAAFKPLLDKPPPWKAKLAKYAAPMRGARPATSKGKAAGKSKPRKRPPPLSFDALERVWPKLSKQARVAIACAGIERIVPLRKSLNYELRIKDLGTPGLEPPPDKDVCDFALEQGWGFVAGKKPDLAALEVIDTWIKANLIHKGGTKRISSTAQCAYKAAYYLLREIRREELEEEAGYCTEQALSMASVGVAIDLRNAGITGDDDNAIDPEELEENWQLRVIAHARAHGKEKVTRKLFAELLAEEPEWKAHLPALKKQFGR